MRIFEHDKEFISIDDLLFINSKRLEKIPSSIWNRLLENDVEKMGKNEELYIELKTIDEKKFANGLLYIYNKNYLDMLSVFQLSEEVELLTKEVERLEMDKTITYETYDQRMKKTKYKFNELLEYINERVIDCCDTCENNECTEDPSRRIGLDENGHPVGYNCPNHMNRLKKLKKYTLN